MIYLKGCLFHWLVMDHCPHDENQTNFTNDFGLSWSHGSAIYWYPRHSNLFFEQLSTMVWTCVLLFFTSRVNDFSENLNIHS